jgi:hypothetical protein
MNLQEFKAWFEGFNENLDGPPNERQWARIMKKISLIKDAKPTTEVVFRDHWYPPWRRYWSFGSDSGETPLKAYLNAQGQNTGVGEISSEEFRRAANSVGRLSDTETVFDAAAAFRELGRAEARSLKK